MVEDDLALLDRWCGDDRDAGNALFKRHFETVYQFFRHKVERREDADELVQETFLAFVRARDGFRRASSFKTYLFTIARHTLYAYWRRRGGRGETVDFDEVSIASLSTSAGTRIAQGQERARLLGALRELPVEQQVLLELYYWEDFESEQLAEVFAVAPATARSRLFRARATLREHLDRSAAAPAVAPGARPDDVDAWARQLRPLAADRGADEIE